MRVIQDSDDELSEDDLETELAVSERKEPPPSQPLTNATYSSLLNGEPGTGSTGIFNKPVPLYTTQLTDAMKGSLERAIEAAHRAHLQESNSPVPTLRLVHSTPDSLEYFQEHRNKRRKIATDGSSSQSLETTVDKQSDHLVDRNSVKAVFSSSLPGHEQEQTGMPQTNEASHFIEGRDWNRQGSFKDHFAQRQPIGPFPEPSSTIPNATLTQQRMLEAAMAPDFLGVDETNMPPYQPAKSSIPWSDYLRPSQESTQSVESAPNSNQPLHHVTRNPQYTTEPLLGSTIGTSRASLEFDPVPQDDHATSIPLKSAPSQLSIHYDGSKRKESTQLACQKNSDDATELLAIASGKSQEQDVQTLSTINGSSTHPHSILESPSLSDDDLAAIGFPKDQYKPRSSRTRSLKVGIRDQANSSIKSEKVGRRSSKRTKTMGEIDEIAVTPRKVQQICDMGFTPSTTEKALKQNQGDVSRTIDWMIATGVADDELAPPKSSKDKTKTQNRKKKVEPVTIDAGQIKVTLLSPVSEEELNVKSNDKSTGAASTENTTNRIQLKASITDDPSNVSEAKCQSVQVVIPRSKKPAIPEGASIFLYKGDYDQQPSLPKTPGKRVKRRKTTLDQPESTTVDHTVENAQASRNNSDSDRFLKNAPPPTERSPKENTQHSLRKTIASEIPPNITDFVNTTAEKRHGSEENTPSRFTLSPASTPTSKKAAAVPDVSRSPEKKEKPGNKSHSPLSKGKVPYRVGLSRRTRIAPLLRTVKK